MSQLRQLEAQFPDTLVVIGVHAGKYPNERRTPTIHHAAQRLGVTHPILNDRKYRTWRAHEVYAWPTLVLIDPLGRVLAKRAGETTAAMWTTVLQQLIKQYDAQNLLDRRLLQIERDQTHEQHGLWYPDKVIADDYNRVFIADTGHHRVLICEYNNDVLYVKKIIGSGKRGAANGRGRSAGFSHPRGMTLNGNTLYVADTGNHMIRAIDLVTDTVSTVAGTGERTTDPFAPGPGLEVALASPWDLVLHRGLLVIAMAGTHQLWSLNTVDGHVQPLAGNAHEAIEDGPLMEAMLAQPCGITSDGTALYFADSESQAIRQAILGDHGRVTTIVGTDLFDFADKDGIGNEVLLQHPQAVVAHDGLLYVADSYNHKIKIVDPQTRACRTWLGARRIPGYKDGDALDTAFNEPGGLGIMGNQLLIADTNNHVIRAADIKTGNVRTLHLVGLDNE